MIIQHFRMNATLPPSHLQPTYLSDKILTHVIALWYLQ